MSNQLSIKAIRNAIKQMDNQSIPDYYIFYVGGRFFKMTNNGTQFSEDGKTYYDWDKDHPVCKWFKDNVL